MPAALHPLLVHFPVALLLTGTGALIWSLFRPAAPALAAFSSVALGLGYAGLVLTVTTGLYDLTASPKTAAREGWTVLAAVHLACGVLLLAVYGLLLYRRYFLLDLLFSPSRELSSAAGEAAPARPSSSPPAPTLETTVWPDSPNSTAPTFRLDKVTLGLAVGGLILLTASAWLGGMLVYDYRVGIS